MLATIALTIAAYYCLVLYAPEVSSPGDNVAWWDVFEVVFLLGALLSLCLLAQYTIFNVVGYRYYVMRDDRRDLHVHSRLYAGGYLGERDGAPVFMNGDILQVKSGGWFREQVVLRCVKQYPHPADPFSAPTRNDYVAVRTWKVTKTDFRGFVEESGPLVRLRDDGGDTVHAFANVALGFIGDCSSILGLHGRMHSLEALADYLGETIVDTIEEIKESKETLGRSKHAQAMRTKLETALANPAVKPHSDRWQKNLLARRMEAEKKVLEESPPPSGPPQENPAATERVTSVPVRARILRTPGLTIRN